MDADLSAAEHERYAAALALPAFGPRSQERLKGSRALVIGAGPVGATAASQIASAGVGYVGVVDPAVVTQRDFVSQSVHFTPDLGVNKADSVAAKLGVLNPEVQVDSYPVELTADNVDAVIAGYEVVLCCVAGSDVRLTVNDACLASDVALVDCTASGTSAAVQLVVPHENACLRCSELRSAGSTDALQPAVGGVAACFAAMVAIKLLSGQGQPASGRLTVDGTNAAVALETIERRRDCSSCAPVEAHA